MNTLLCRREIEPVFVNAEPEVIVTRECVFRYLVVGSEQLPQPVLSWTGLRYSGRPFVSHRTTGRVVSPVTMGEFRPPTSPSNRKVCQTIREIGSEATVWLVYLQLGAGLYSIAIQHRPVE